MDVQNDHHECSNIPHSEHDFHHLLNDWRTGNRVNGVSSLTCADAPEALVHSTFGEDVLSMVEVMFSVLGCLTICLMCQ
mgnify:CR=1 FL=1